jgi:hypothetical protein
LNIKKSDVFFRYETRGIIRYIQGLDAELARLEEQCGPSNRLVLTHYNMASKSREIARQSRVERIDKTWLRNPISVAEAEAKHLVDFSLSDNASEADKRIHSGRLKFARMRSVPLDGKPVPFGFANAQWLELVASIRPGDELWEFSSPQHSWEHTAGRVGIVLVRNGNIYDCMLTALS